MAELTVLPSPERPPPAADSARGSGGRELGRAEIREALNQYVQAINARSVAQLRAIYPALPADRESQWKDIFRNDVKDLKAGLSVGEISEAGESAEAVFEVQLSFTPQRQQRQEYRILARAILRRVNGVWRITSLRESGS